MTASILSINFEYSFKIYKDDTNFVDVPLEILQHIFFYLNFKDLSRAAFVSKSWRVVSEDDKLWDRHFKNLFRGCLCQHESSNWKKNFKDHFLLPNQLTEIREISHDTTILDLIVSEQTILCASKESIVVRQNQTGEVIYSLVPNQEILSIDAHREFIAGGFRRSVCVWNTNTNSEQMDFKLYIGTVNDVFTNVKVHDQWVAGASGRFIKTWQKEKEQKTYHIFSCADKVNALTLTDTLLFAMTTAVTKIWNIPSKSEIRQLGSSGKYMSFNGNILVSGGMSRIGIYDLEYRTDKSIDTVCSVSCISILDTYIVTGSSDRTIKIWDRNTGFCKRIFTVDSPVTAIRVFNKSIYVGLKSGSIKIFYKPES